MNLLVSRCGRDGIRPFHRAAARVPVVAAACGALICVACSSPGAPRVADHLDPITGNTVSVLEKPAQLITVESRGPSRDPFAFAAPFDIDRMGNRELYLWISIPQDSGTPRDVKVLCDGQPLGLTIAQLDLGRLQLSHAPYPQVAPWYADRYFRLPAAALGCLAAAHSMTITFATGGQAAHEEQFAADPTAIGSFAAFAAHLDGP